MCNEFLHTANNMNIIIDVRYTGRSLFFRMKREKLLLYSKFEFEKKAYKRNDTNTNKQPNHRPMHKHLNQNERIETLTANNKKS